MSTAFATFVAGSLRFEDFSAVDIGCSGGIDPTWRVFGERLRVLAFDASLDECERLNQQENNPKIRYVGGFVGMPKDHPFKIALAEAPARTRDSFFRTSAARILEIENQRLKNASLAEKLHHNAWNLTKLGDQEAPIVVPELLEREGWTNLDLLKIDIDGPDFQVLNSFDGYLDKLGVMAARFEVNFSGGTHPTEHVFANTDLFMRTRGFELLALDVRTYTMSALPSPFAITAPAQTISGRPIQGEAYYARDLAGPEWRAYGATLRPEKLAKLAAVFSMWGQPDAAAELLLNYRPALSDVFNTNVGLELLAGQAQAHSGRAHSYSDYIAAFERGDASFYPSSKLISPRTLGRRLEAAVGSFKNPDHLA